MTTCRDLDSPSNGAVSYNAGSVDQRPIETTATHTCNDGYTLNGEMKRHCSISGTWNGSMATCVGKCLHAPLISFINPELLVLNFISCQFNLISDL